MKPHYLIVGAIFVGFGYECVTATTQHSEPQQPAGTPITVYTGHLCEKGIAPFKTVNEAVADWLNIFLNPLQDCFFKQNDLIKVLKKLLENTRFKKAVIEVLKTIEFCILVDFIEEHYHGFQPSIIQFLDKTFDLDVKFSWCWWRQFHCPEDNINDFCPIDFLDHDEYYGLDRCKRRVRKYCLTSVIETIIARWKEEFKSVQELIKEDVHELRRFNEITGILRCFKDFDCIKTMENYETIGRTDVHLCPLVLPHDEKVCSYLLSVAKQILQKYYNADHFANWWNCQFLQTGGGQCIVNLLGSNIFKNILYNVGTTPEWEELVIVSYKIGICLDELFELILL